MKQTRSRLFIRWGLLLLPVIGTFALLGGTGSAVRATTVASPASHYHSASLATRPLASGLVLPIATIRAGAMEATGSMTMPSSMKMPGGMVMAGKSSTGLTVRLHQKLVRVTIFNFAFRPARLVVSPGTRIIWTNKDSDPHTVDSTANIWSSDALDTGNTFARVFSKAGAFTYYCSIHPFMHGEIIVKK